MDLLYSVTQRDGREFVQYKLYELYTAGTSQLITFDNWSLYIQPGAYIEMGIILVNMAGPFNLERQCPYCCDKMCNKATAGEVTWSVMVISPLYAGSDPCESALPAFADSRRQTKIPPSLHTSVVGFINVWITGTCRSIISVMSTNTCTRLEMSLGERALAQVHISSFLSASQAVNGEDLTELTTTRFRRVHVVNVSIMPVCACDEPGNHQSSDH